MRMDVKMIFSNGLYARILPVLAVSVMLLSCAAIGGNQQAATPAPQPSATPVAVPAADTPAPVTLEQRLSGDMVYDILLGEIAGQRGAMDVSVARYMQAAGEAQDPRVAERAVQIASFAKQYDLAIGAARRWVALDGANMEARKALTALALQQGDLDEVITQMDYMLINSSDPEDSFRMVTAVLARHEDKQAAMTAVRKLVDRHPDSPHAWTSLSRLAIVAEQPDVALDAVNHALALQPGSSDIIILKAQVMVRQAQKAEATALLGDAVSRQPNNADLRFAYGRMLLDSENLEGAKQQFRKVVKIDPTHADALYSLALLELETGVFQSGEKHLVQLLELKQHVQNAYYYLGYATAEQGKAQEALDWYLKVESGDYWSQAQLRAAGLMVKQGDFVGMQEHMRSLRQKNPQLASQLYIIEGQALTDAKLHMQAYSLYETALESSPDDIDLLYSYSLAAEKLDKLDVAETNLRRILAIDPDNVRALNAFGYTLADRTDRHQEALQYISKAYAKEPDDPAIIDSMGWVHFRMGDLDKAREYLQRAWEMSSDSEIGAHFGEVLWMRGEHAAAKEVWNSSREATPDNPVLLEVINRLNP
ncbi:MAG: tetratricopeptide repeat protein [Gammaproteobacteria bacterium]|nr:tetratricopeptide repeat protein [Gammaproteobacteria bacterium]